MFKIFSCVMYVCTYLLRLKVLEALHFWNILCVSGKKINRVACGSAHSLAWSTHKPVSAGRLPTQVPMEFNHLVNQGMPALRNRLVLLHHFSDLFCPSLPMFHLQDSPRLGATLYAGSDMAAASEGGGRILGVGMGSVVVEKQEDTTTGLDALRGVLVSSAKVCDFFFHICIWKPSCYISVHWCWFLYLQMDMFRFPYISKPISIHTWVCMCTEYSYKWWQGVESYKWCYSQRGESSISC